MKIISVGEVLWDIFDEQELLGGAPLNFSASLQRLGHSVTLITGVGDDRRGEQTIERMRALGLSTEFVQRAADRATGTARVTLDAGGHATFVIPRPAAFDALSTDAGQMGRLEQLHADWLYFGTLAQTDETNCRLIGDICGRMAGVRGFYDMNLREGHWSLALVQRLSTLANVVKMNDEEAEILGGLTWPGGAFSLEDFCRGWAGEHRLEVICVTLGSQGCAVFTDGALHRFPGYKVPVADTVGAGDAFAAGFVHALSQPWPLETRAAFANALGALVASRPGATPDWTPEECRMLMTEDQSLRP